VWIIKTLPQNSSWWLVCHQNQPVARQARFPESSGVAVIPPLDFFADSTFEFITIGGPPGM